MKITMKSLLLLSMVVAAVLLAGCGKDGEPGPAGANGQNGENGDNGTNGTGLDSAMQFGSITITFEGQRPDAVAFEKTLTFPYTPNNDLQASYLYTDDGYYVQLTRLMAGADREYDDRNVYISWNCSNFTTEDGTLSVEGGIGFYAPLEFEEDHTYFYVSTETGVSAIDNFSYNEATGALSGEFEFEYNEDITAHVQIDVIVHRYQYID